MPPPGVVRRTPRSHSPCVLIAGLQTQISPRSSWSPNRPWRSDWCAPSPRSGTRGSCIGFESTPNCPTGRRPVVAVIYLIYNEGYVATAGESPDRVECGLSNSPGVFRYRAHARRSRSYRAARIAAAHRVAQCRQDRADSSWVRLPAQDRSLWDRDLIAEGQTWSSLARRDNPALTKIQAAIAAVHSDTTTAADTTGSRSWRSRPVVCVGAYPRGFRTNRAIAVVVEL